MSADIVDLRPSTTPPAPKRAKGMRVQRKPYCPSAAAIEKGEVERDLVHAQAELERLAHTIGQLTLRMIRLRVE